MAQESHGWRDDRPRCRPPMKVVGPVSVWICCQEVCEVVTHWTGGRSLPCAAYFGAASCEMCDVEVPRLKEFWLLVCDFRPRTRPVLCKLTPGAIERSPNLMAHNGDLHGRLLQLSRLGTTVYSPMAAGLIDTPDSVVLPDPGDVLGQLRRLWGAQTKSRKGVGDGGI
jgi:hypothetical protein